MDSIEQAPAPAPEGTVTTASNTLTSGSSAASTNGAISNGNGHKSQLAEAVAVDDRTIVVADPVEGETEEEAKKNRKQVNIFAAIGILSVIVAIVLAVLLSPRDGGAGSSDALNSTKIPPSEEDGTETAVNNGEEYGQRWDDMVAIMASLYEDSEGGVEVFDVSSPFASEDRINTLEWLVKTDTAQVPIPIRNETAGEDENYEQEVYKLQQRYVLALLYFATNGENWHLHYNFLSGIDECQWSNLYTQALEDDDKSYIEDEFAVKGVLCNDAGTMEKLLMWWNGMSGTIPHELSFFSDSLNELNFAGGSMGGPIPSSLTKLTELKGLSLSDNCFTGDLPEKMNYIDMPKLEILAVHMNGYGLGLTSDNLSPFCNGSGGPNEGVIAVAVDCPSEEFGFDEFGNATKIPYDCDCCICCSPEEYRCTHLASGGSWTSHFLDDISPNGYPMGFDTQCTSVEQESWIADNCPCVINVSTAETQPFIGQCVTDCSQEGAIPSYDFGS